MKKPAVFVDRDGTINEQMGYINHVSRFVLLPGVTDALRLLNRSNFWVIVTSNQSGVGRGYFPIQLVEDVHAHMRELLEGGDAYVDEIFFCPHHPRAEVREYRVDCECRKPKKGLVDMACETFEIDMNNSYVIGDRYSDIEMAHRSNLKGILVKTGYGLGEVDHVVPSKVKGPDFIAADLSDAVKWILES